MTNSKSKQQNNTASLVWIVSPHLFYLIATMILLTACRSEKAESQMILTVAKEKAVIELRGNGRASIDWGDGTKDENFKISPRYYSYNTHIYSDTLPHTITIIGKNITALLCLDSLLIDLDISNNLKLKDLRVINNQLTNLDVAKNIALVSLDCGYNQLTNLDISKNSALMSLRCRNNHLTNLDVSKNTNLKELYCGNNQLTNLDVSKNTALEWLNFSNNNLSETAINELFSTLHSMGGIIYLSTDNCDKSIAKKKGWMVIVEEDKK